MKRVRNFEKVSLKNRWIQLKLVFTKQISDVQETIAHVSWMLTIIEYFWLFFLRKSVECNGVSPVAVIIEGKNGCLIGNCITSLFDKKATLAITVVPTTPGICLTNVILINIGISRSIWAVGSFLSAIIFQQYVSFSHCGQKMPPPHLLGQHEFVKKASLPLQGGLFQL